MAVVVAFPMDTLLALATARVVGILGSPAQTGEPQPALQGPPPVYDDLVTIVDVLPLEELLAGSHDEVVKMNTQGTTMGLAWGTRVGPPGPLDWA